MSVETVEILVEGVNAKVDPRFSKYNSGGLKTADGWLNVAKKVPIAQFAKNETYKLEIETNEKGYRTVVGVAGDKVVEKKAKSPIPSIPKTAVEDTPAPGGVAPVAKAGDDKGFKAKDSEKMTKADWGAKDKSIETQAVLKSVLESPAYAQLVVGKKEAEAFDIGARMFEFFLERFYAAKG